MVPATAVAVMVAVVIVILLLLFPGDDLQARHLHHGPSDRPPGQRRLAIVEIVIKKEASIMAKNRHF